MSYIKSIRDCTANVHLLVTSRPEHDIRSAIESWAHDSEIIHLQSTEVKDDINLYIKAKVSQLSRWQKRPGIQNDIETVLSDKANGICLDPDSIHRELARLPWTLDETYERILKNVDPSHRDSAIRLLQFLVYSERPLTLAEAVDAVAVKISEEPRFDPEYRMPCPKEIVGFCSSLAVLVQKKVSSWSSERWEGVEEDVVEIQLAHFSVQEYLMSDRLQGDMAHELDHLSANTALTTVCLSYLFSLYRSCQPKEAREDYPLARYSARYWPAYAAVAEQSAKGMLPIVRKYFTSMPAITFCCQIYDHDELWDSGYLISEESPGAALYYASLTGLRYSTKALIDAGAEVDFVYGKYDYALLAAIDHGHHEIVQMLVDKGAKVDGESERYWEALVKSIEEGNQKTLQILIDHVVNDQPGIGYILAEVVKLGNSELVRKLINDGANVNEGAGQEGYPTLLNAFIQGDPKMIQLLLDHGADINVWCQDDGGVLMAALKKGDQEIARILIDNEADVDVQDEDGNSALQVAASWGFQEIVQLLIDKGVNINAQYGQGIDALLYAINGGHQDFVQLLIDSGVNIHATGMFNDTALEVAMIRGREEILMMLRVHGLDSNAQNGYGEALIKASHSGDEGMVKSLLNHGIDVNADSRYLGTALQTASGRGHEAIVELLINHGADVNADSGYLGTALQAAASSDRNEAIVKILLDRGVGINAKSRYFRNALRRAEGFLRKEGIKEMLIKFEKDQDANHFERPMALSPFFRNEQKDSY